MEKAPENKMMKSAQEAPEASAPAAEGYSTKREFFYPDHGKTVIAGSQQEADEALAQITSDATIKA